MHREIDFPHAELGTLVNNLADIFIQRRDLYARQLDDGRYVCIHKPLDARRLVSHLKGTITLGTYLLDQDSRCRFIVIDADDDNQMGNLLSLANSLAGEGVPAYLESSRRGGHLWMFFSRAIPGRDARAFGNGLLTAYDLTDVELFPKQDQLKAGPGSLIRLPFGIHRRTGRRYGFITLKGQPLASTPPDQIRVLSTPQYVPDAFFESYQTYFSSHCEDPVSERLRGPNSTMAERIKASISVYDLISQYVELTPAGRGLCPYHDDHRPSFSVNDEDNYWHCFAGCGGGSVVDWWMRWRDCDFTTAVAELAKRLC